MVLSTINFFLNDNDIYKYIILNIRNMFEYRNLLWYLLLSPTLLQRRSLDNGASCFRGIGSTSSRGAGNRKTITNGANNDVNGYSGPFTYSDCVNGSRNSGGEVDGIVTNGS